MTGAHHDLGHVHYFDTFIREGTASTGETWISLLDENTIVSGSEDTTLRVWDLTKKIAPEDIRVNNSDVWVINSDSEYD